MLALHKLPQDKHDDGIFKGGASIASDLKL